MNLSNNGGHVNHRTWPTYRAAYYGLNQRRIPHRYGLRCCAGQKRLNLWQCRAESSQNFRAPTRSSFSGDHRHACVGSRLLLDYFGNNPRSLGWRSSRASLDTGKTCVGLQNRGLANDRGCHRG